MNLSFQKLNPDAILPVRATPQSAGLDLFACLKEPLVLSPHEFCTVPTGLAAAPDSKEVMLMICARSGLASRHGITMANGVGIVDSDYRGEIRIPLINQSEAPFVVTNGMRIAQLIVVPVLFPEAVETDALPDSRRGRGGFGSTGV